MKRDKNALKPNVYETGWTNGYLAYFLIAFIAIGIYLPTLNYTFSPLDDEWLIAKRIDLYQNFGSLKIFFSEVILENYYRPVWIASYMPDAIIGGSNPMVFHFFNAVYHSVAAMLFYAVLKKINTQPKTALVLGLLFVVHPIQTQSVAFIPGRVDMLLGIFCFTSFISLLEYEEHKRPVHLLLSLISLLLALFTKESAIVIPFVFVTFFVLQQIKISGKTALYFVFAFFLTAAWFLVRHLLVPVYLSPGDRLVDSLLDAVLAFLMYAGKSLLPVGQALLPTVAETNMFPFVVAVSVLLVVIWKFGLKDKRKVLFGFLWFAFLIFIPLLAGSTRPNSEHFEQRMYVPLAGILIVVSQIDFSPLALRFNKLFLQIVLLSILLFFSIKTLVRSRVYRSPAVMATTAIQESPHAIYFYIVLGRVCAVNNMPEEAIKWYDKYIEVRPSSAIPYANKAAIFFGMKKYGQAIESIDRAIQAEPDNPGFYKDRARANYFMQKYESALADLHRIVQLGGKVDGEFAEKVEYGQKIQNDIKMYSLQIGSDTATAYSLIRRGMAFFYLNDFRSSIRDFSMALDGDPKNPFALVNRGWTYEALGKADSAYSDYVKLAGMGYPEGQTALENLKKKFPAKNF